MSLKGFLADLERLSREKGVIWHLHGGRVVSWVSAGDDLSLCCPITFVHWGKTGQLRGEGAALVPEVADAVGLSRPDDWRSSPESPSDAVKVVMAADDTGADLWPELRADLLKACGLGCGVVWSCCDGGGDE